MSLDPRTQAFFSELSARASHLTPEQQAAIKTLQSAAENDKQIGDTLLRSVSATAENTRRAQELQRERDSLQKEIDAEKAKIAAYSKQLETWRGEITQEVSESREQAQKAIAKLAELRGKALAAGTLTESDLAFEDILKPSRPPVSPQSSPSAPAQKFLTQEEALQFGQSTLSGVAGLFELAEEHKELFGNRLPVAQLMQQAQASGRPLLEVYNETYNPDARRRELQDQALTRRAEEMAAQLVEQKMKDILSALPTQGNPLNPGGAVTGSSYLFSDDFRNANPDGTPAHAPRTWTPQDDQRLYEEAAQDFALGLAGARK